MEQLWKVVKKQQQQLKTNSLCVFVSFVLCVRCMTLTVSVVRFVFKFLIPQVFFFGLRHVCFIVFFFFSSNDFFSWFIYIYIYALRWSVCVCKTRGGGMDWWLPFFPLNKRRRKTYRIWRTYSVFELGFSVSFRRWRVREKKKSGVSVVVQV